MSEYDHERALVLCPMAAREVERLRKELDALQSQTAPAVPDGWRSGYPVYDGDGGVCHIPLKGHPDYMTVAFNSNGELVDGCGDDIGYGLDDVERWKPIDFNPAPPSVAVPEGWRLQKVESEETTISVHRKSDGRWCAGGIKGWDGRQGLLFEFFDAMLTAAPSPDHSGDANKMVAMLREIVDMWDGPRYALQMKPLIDRARTLLAGYEATPSVPESEALPVRYYAICSEDEDLFEPDDDGLDSALSKLAELEAAHTGTAWDLIAVADLDRLRTADDEGDES